ncbi:MAG: HEAT repeat domain-containing protein [Verrucomicrobiota bacterium]
MPGRLTSYWKTAKDANWEVRKASVEALGRLKDERALSPMIERLADTDADVRLATVEALGQLAFNGAVEALIGSLIDEHAPVRRAAEGALRRIDRTWEQSEATQGAAPKLKAALNANDYTVRQAAADVLNKIGAGTAVQRTPATLSHAAAHRRHAAVEVFTACLVNLDRDVRLAAVEALGRISDAGSRSALHELSTDPEEDEWVRSAAESVLPKLGGTCRAQVLPGATDPGRDKIVPLTLWDRDAKQRSS